MNEQVFVQFGGRTDGLDKASDKAAADIKKVKNEATGLGAVFQQVRDRMSGLFNNIPGMDRAQVAFASIKDGAGKAAKGFSDLDVAASRAVTGGLARIGIVAAGVTAAIVALTAAIGGLIFAGLYTMSRALADAGVQVDKLAQKLGMSRREVQQWSLVAKGANVDANVLSTGVQQLQRNMILGANGSRRQAAAFRELGIDVKNAKSSTDTFLQLADKFQNMENGPKKTALAMQLLGRSGTELIPILNEGSDSLEKMMKAAEDTGAVMSDELVAASKELDENLNTVSMGATGLKNILYEALAPTMIWVTETVKGWILALIESYRTGGAVKKMVDIMVVSFKVLISVTIALGSAFVAAFNVIRGAVMAGFNAVRTFAEVMARLKAGDFAGAASAGWNGLKNVVNDVTGAVQGAWGAFKGGKGAIDSLWNAKMPGALPDIKTGGDTDLDLGGGRGGRSRRGAGDKGDAEAKAKAREQLQYKLEQLERMQEAVEGNFAEELRLEDEKIALIKAFYGEQSKEYEKALADREKMVRKHAEKQKEIERELIDHRKELAQIDLDTANEMAMLRLDAEREALDQRVAMGKMSASQRAQAEIQLVQQEWQLQFQHEQSLYQLKMQALRDKLALLPIYSDAYRKMLQDIEAAEREHNAKMRVLNQKAGNDIAKVNNQAAQASVNKWKSITDPITQAFGGMLTNLYNRSMNWKQALLGALDQIVLGFLNKGIEMLSNWVAMELAKTAATTTNTATRTAAETTAATTGAAVSAAAGMTQITTNAAVGAAGAAAATAPIPFIGPALAPGAAAAALAMILGFGAMIASAAGGYDIPAGVNPLTQLHEKEMVLPASIAEPLRRSLSGRSPGASGGLGATTMAGASSMRSEMSSRGGDSTFNYQPNVSHSDMSLERALQTEGRTMRRWMERQLRNGTIKLPGK